MITFIIALVVLIVGYIVYGKIVEKIFGIDSKRTTPALSMTDGVDYVPMKPWRIFMIQFLNIAGLGPIFGAIMGAKFGTASFLWIVFGSIFAGGVHDFLSGMLSLRMNGASLPEIHGKYLGNTVKQIMRGFMVILMVLVGVVFVVGPAGLLADITPDFLTTTFWIIIILCYYLIATLLPIDKLIGRIYPFFGACLIFMALGILVAIFIHHPPLPEIWEGLGNKHPHAESNPLFPMMFISIACGAISGFHATQSPLMARTMTNEKQGRPIFYGAMILEGVIALIWAAAASYFFFDTQQGQAFFQTGTNATVVVKDIANEWLNVLGFHVNIGGTAHYITIGVILAILGVVFAPITSGDTALRSARLIVADFLHLDQKPILKRLLIAIPLFLVTFGVLMFSLKDKDGFELIWRYFAWANQTLAVFTLWAITVYLTQKHKPFIITLLPALFMTMVCTSFLLISKDCFGLPPLVSYIISSAITATTLIWFFVWKKKFTRRIEN
ncbi:MAG: carbon starvation protein A [Bacteroidales bacterium]|jgi:carbon starvation protein CstA|nr:carbon starvation protein A [Bacteroidales bacterium]